MWRACSSSMCGKFARQRILRDAHVEAVREAVAVEAVQGLEPVGPVLGERLAAAAVDLEARAPGVGGADLEAGGEDDAVDLVLDAVEHQALLGDALDALAAGVDQRDVGPVEGRQIFVVEGRALAELAVPGLERLGGLLGP